MLRWLHANVYLRIIFHIYIDERRCRLDDDDADAYQYFAT